LIKEVEIHKSLTKCFEKMQEFIEKRKDMDINLSGSTANLLYI
jgi:hypothetical protein